MNLLFSTQNDPPPFPCSVVTSGIQLEAQTEFRYGETGRNGRNATTVNEALLWRPSVAEDPNLLPQDHSSGLAKPLRPEEEPRTTQEYTLLRRSDRLGPQTGAFLKRRPPAGEYIADIFDFGDKPTRSYATRNIGAAAILP